jgi:hypothetical protein
MQTQIIQYHLFGDGLCGRAVRVRELTASEVEDNANLAASLVSDNDKIMKLSQIEVREGIKMMLVAISKKAGLKPEEVAKLRAGDWEQLTISKLKMPNSEYFYEAIFSRAKDHAFMARLFRRLHTPKETDIDAIVEKGCPVATEDDPPAIGLATGTGG